MIRLNFIVILLFLFIVSNAYGIDRNPGKWKSIPLNPAVGRMVDIVFDPNDGDRMYAAPDANGIWYTGNLGKNWECITDNIPEVDARISNNVIMVDPDNFDKVYYVSKYGHYYITQNRGRDWKRVTNSKGEPVFLTAFKRALLSRDKKTGRLIMVSTTEGGDYGKKSADWPKGVHVSWDEGQTWTHFPDPSKEEQFLEIAIHPANPKIIYAPSTNKLYKSVDGGKTFNIALDFSEPKGDYSSIATIESNPDWVFLITTRKANESVAQDTKRSALYLSKDAGKTWETIQNMDQKIGWEKCVINDVNNWLHCFAVNSSNPDEILTADGVMFESEDRGKTWEVVPWYGRRKALNADGSLTLSKYGQHVADNHVIKFHPLYRSRAYKACDSGLYMKDSDAGFDSWVNISGNMDAMLFYSVKVNEFGDRYIVGNTQDVDIQTYQYGKWQNARGYEGDVVFIHPYTNFAYYPYCMCTDGTEIKGLFDLEKEEGEEKGLNANIYSWGRPQISVNYSRPEEAFILSKPQAKNSKKNSKMAFFTDDYGKTADTIMIPTEKNVLYMSISRTAKQQVTAIAENGVFVSIDNGKNWKIKTSPSQEITFGAVDPDHPNRIWVSTRQGEVFETLDGAETWQLINSGLPKGEIMKLIYHEGSVRDLYALAVDGDGQWMRPRGVYYLSTTSSQWQKWMDGYSLDGFSDMVIDYPTQRLLASSYGRGVWEADLARPCERFLTGDIALKETNSIGQLRTFTLDVPFHLPEYYNFKWKVNGQFRGENSMWFSVPGLHKNDMVTCTLTPKASPDIQTTTLPYIIKDKPSESEKTIPGVLTADGGYAELGYYDYWGPNRDFSIDFFLKPETNGVVLSNRRLNEHDAKGFILYIDGDDLKVKYSAHYQTTDLYGNDTCSNDDQNVKLKARIAMSKWNHVALVIDRDGMAKLFINGEKLAEKMMSISELDAGFNSLLKLHLFADAFGSTPLKGTIDNLRFHNQVLADKDIALLAKTSGITATTKAFFSFDAAFPEKQTESFTGQKLRLIGDVKIIKDELLGNK